jgi:hypothetical protein
MEVSERGFDTQFGGELDEIADPFTGEGSFTGHVVEQGRGDGAATGGAEMIVECHSGWEFVPVRDDPVRMCAHEVTEVAVLGPVAVIVLLDVLDAEHAVVFTCVEHDFLPGEQVGS